MAPLATGAVPVAVLSAIIVVAALRLLDVPQMRFLLGAKSVDGWIAVLTFAATIVTGILEGIAVGVVASLLALLYRISRPHIPTLGHLPGTRSFRDPTFSPGAYQLEGILNRDFRLRFLDDGGGGGPRVGVEPVCLQEQGIAVATTIGANPVERGEGDGGKEKQEGHARFL